MQTNFDSTGNQRWTPFFLAGLAATCVTLIFWPTAHSIILIWSASETFAHGYFVVPVFIWLLWRKRELLLALPARPDLRALVLIALSGALWLMSKLAGIQVGEHIAFALIFIFTLWAVLGRHIANEIKFPLFFLLFLAPAGEELVPVLMDLTADMTIWAIRITGIPIHREGLFFSLPSGNWSVVEACSGIRYLIASAVLGTLYAYLSYSSLRLRLFFVVISLIVPIFANSARAYIIVMLGHFSGNKLATGVDHLIYGWMFFGIVMFALFSIGAWLQRYDVAVESKANTREESDSISTTSESRSVTRSGFKSQATAMAAIFAVVASWPVWSAVIDARQASTLSTEVASQLLPQGEQAEAGLNIEPTAALWQPRNSGHDHRLGASYLQPGLPSVRAIAFVYEHQRQGKEMISSGNVLVRSKDDYWRVARTASRNVALKNGASVVIRETELSNISKRLTIWQWYRIGESITANPVEAKLLEVRDRLLLRNSISVNYMLVINGDGENNLQELMAAMDVINTNLVP